MALKYELIPDSTAENADQHKAVAVNKKEISLEEIIGIIMDRGCVRLSKKEMRGIVENYVGSIESAAHSDGEEEVRTPLRSVRRTGVE